MKGGCSSLGPSESESHGVREPSGTQWDWKVVLFDSFLGKTLPPSLSVPLQSMAREIWFIKQSSASASPGYVVQTHTRTLFPETRARRLSSTRRPCFAFSPCLSTPSGSRWVRGKKDRKCKCSQPPE